MQDQCDPETGPQFAVATETALFTVGEDALEVLLIERSGDPCRGVWALPCGFVRPDETLEEAAARGLAEEAGFDGSVRHLEQLAAYGPPDRSPGRRVITIAYWAVCASLPVAQGSGNARARRLAPVPQIETGAVPLAFPRARIVRDAAERIRSGLEHTALAARFCPPAFTIRELRRIYETIWDVSLDPGNFHRHVRESRLFRPFDGAPGRDTDHLRLQGTARTSTGERAAPDRESRKPAGAPAPSKARDAPAHSGTRRDRAASGKALRTRAAEVGERKESAESVTRSHGSDVPAQALTGMYRALPTTNRAASAREGKGIDAPVRPSREPDAPAQIKVQMDRALSTTGPAASFHARHVFRARAAPVRESRSIAMPVAHRPEPETPVRRSKRTSRGRPAGLWMVRNPDSDRPAGTGRMLARPRRASRPGPASPGEDP